MKLKIGIIGKGFVGSAVEFGFSAQTGEQFELGNLKITIMNINTYEKNLIKLNQHHIYT